MHETIDVGTHVFVINEKTDEVEECVVTNQEWWGKSNPHHPVYYDLIDLKGRNVHARCTGNWHFNDVFRERSAAEELRDIMRRAR